MCVRERDVLCGTCKQKFDVLEADTTRGSHKVFRESLFKGRLLKSIFLQYTLFFIRTIFYCTVFMLK